MPPSDGLRGPTRSTPVTLMVVAGLLLVARVALGIWDAANPESRPELVNWTAPSAAVDEARARGRLLLYAFTDRGVPASRKLAAEIFADAQSAQRIDKQFVAVRLEGKPADDPPEIAELRARYKIREMPSLVVTTPDGARAKVVAGYRNASGTLSALAQASMEVMGLPFARHGGFRFQVGGPAADSSVTSEADSLLRGR